MVDFSKHFELRAQFYCAFMCSAPVNCCLPTLKMYLNSSDSHDISKKDLKKWRCSFLILHKFRLHAWNSGTNFEWLVREGTVMCNTLQSPCKKRIKKTNSWHEVGHTASSMWWIARKKSSDQFFFRDTIASSSCVNVRTKWVWNDIVMKYKYKLTCCQIIILKLDTIYSKSDVYISTSVFLCFVSVLYIYS